MYEQPQPDNPLHRVIAFIIHVSELLLIGAVGGSIGMYFTAQYLTHMGGLCGA